MTSVGTQIVQALTTLARPETQIGGKLHVSGHSSDSFARWRKEDCRVTSNKLHVRNDLDPHLQIRPSRAPRRRPFPLPIFLFLQLFLHPRSSRSTFSPSRPSRSFRRAPFFLPKTRRSPIHRRPTPPVHAASRNTSSHVARVAFGPSQVGPRSGSRLCQENPILCAGSISPLPYVPLFSFHHLRLSCCPFYNFPFHLSLFTIERRRSSLTLIDHAPTIAHLETFQ